MATIRKRLLKKGGFVYFVDFYHNGKRVRKSLKTSDKKTAELIAKDIEVKLAKDTWGFEQIDKKKDILLEDFIKEYLEYSRANKAYKTYQADELALRNLANFTGRTALSSIDAKTIEQFKIERLKTVKPVSVNFDLRHLKSIFSTAKKWGYISQNPLSQVRMVKDPNPTVPRFLTLEEIDRLLEACDEDWFRKLIQVYLYTGMRRNELVNLRWENVDLERGVITVRSEREFATKTGKHRIIPINEKLKKILDPIPKDDYIFSVKGKKLDPDFVTKKFNRLVKEAQSGPDVHLHTLRHTFASHLVMAGVDLVTVKELLGHSDLKVTQIYAHLAPDHLRMAVTRLPY